VSAPPPGPGGPPPPGRPPPEARGWDLVAIVLAALVFLFPILAATTSGGGSYVYVLLLAAGLWWGWGWREMDRRESALAVGLGVAFLAMALGLIHTDDVGSGLSRMERFGRIASIVLIFLALRRRGLGLDRALGAGAVAATLVMAGQAWYQVERAGGEHASGAYHPIVFGDLALLWGALGVLFALVVIRGWTGWLTAGAAAGAATYASVLSQARGGWLFVPVFLVVLGWMARSFDPSGRWRLRGITAVVLSGAVIGVWQAEPIVERVRLGAHDLRTFAEEPDAETSWGIRLNLWRNSLLLAREHPLVGAGLGDFQAHMREMVQDGRSWNPWVADFAHAHSIYFDALATAGILGLTATVVAYLVLPFWFFGGMVSAVQPARETFLALGGVVTVLAFATFGLSEALWTRNPFVNTYVVCMAVFLGGLSGEAARRKG
jgi:O-antigen ligase